MANFTKTIEMLNCINSVKRNFNAKSLQFSLIVYCMTIDNLGLET